MRPAAIMALFAFATCLIIGGVAGNPFATAVGRALAAMSGTFVVALIVVAMGRRMISEVTPPQQGPAANSTAEEH